MAAAQFWAMPPCDAKTASEPPGPSFGVPFCVWHGFLNRVCQDRARNYVVRSGCLGTTQRTTLFPRKGGLPILVLGPRARFLYNSSRARSCGCVGTS